MKCDNVSQQDLAGASSFLLSIEAMESMRDPDGCQKGGACSRKAQINTGQAIQVKNVM